jgi:hypothetical protein
MTPKVVMFSMDVGAVPQPAGAAGTETAQDADGLLCLIAFFTLFLFS